MQKNLKVVEVLEGIARRKGCTPAQLALAWLIARDIVPIPRTKSRKHLEDNVKALDVKITGADAKQLEAIAGMLVGTPRRC